MNKKGQGLSVNVIIVAIIALVVLVVLVAIFTGKLGIFSRGVDEISNCSQICQARGYPNGAPELENGVEPSGFDSEDKLLAARDGNARQCYCKK